MAGAADLQVSPVRIILAPDQRTGLMTITNRGSDDTLIQMNIVAWAQSGAEDVMTPTRDVLANPGVFLLRGGEQQVARFALRVGQDAKERSYRIVVQEVPRQHVANSITTVLRLLVPIFVAPPNPGVTLEWGARQVGDGVELTVRNTGNTHVQIKSLSLSAGSGATQQRQLSVYVLAGNSRAIKFPAVKAAAADKPLAIAVDSDQGRFTASVRMGVGVAKGASGGG